MENESVDKIPGAPVKSSRGGLFFLVTLFTLFVLPLLIAASLFLFILSQPAFYTGILKDGRLITALLETRYSDMDRTISREIENKTGLSGYSARHERVTAAYEAEKRRYEALNKNEDYDTLMARRKEIRALSYGDSGELFKSRKDYNDFKKDELAKISSGLKSIQEHRKTNSGAISEAEQVLDRAESEYKSSSSELEKRKQQALLLVEEQRESYSSGIYEDLKRLQPSLTAILNEKLIDSQIEPIIAGFLDFVTSYNRQIDMNRVYFERDIETGIPQLKIKLPSLSFSLWINDEKYGVERRRHLLSQILVEEIEKYDGLKNKRFLLTSFRLSDTVLGEYFGNRFLSKYNVFFRDGIIQADTIMLEGESALKFQNLMIIMSAGRNLIYVTASLFAFFILCLIFSKADRKKRLRSAKIVFILPSVIVLAACGAAFFLPGYIPDLLSSAVPDMTSRIIIQALMESAVPGLVIPLAAVFGVLLGAGLIIRKKE